jgi:glycerophosphoryl diester phosphodiesterase
MVTAELKLPLTGGRPAGSTSWAVHPVEGTETRPDRTVDCMLGLAPVIIGHRGAAGYRPEHTLASYRLAIEMGADYIEPDLVSTRDGVLVARHENEIGATTDVAVRPRFAGRRTTRMVGGQQVTGWFTEDFTLGELKTLRARERIPHVRPANTWYDGRFEIPTLDEILDLAERGGRARGVTIGVYPETKHPSHFDSLGLSLEEPLADTLRRHHLDRPNASVMVQSFETANLRELASMVAVPLVQLVDADGAPYDLCASGDARTYRDLVTGPGLADVATYASAIGVHKSLVLGDGAGGGLVRAAHSAGLLVHAWTVRDENRYLDERFRSGSDPQAHGDSAGETLALLDAGVDGVFTDHADTAVAARSRWLARQGHPAPPAPLPWPQAQGHHGDRSPGLLSPHGATARRRPVRGHW